MALLNPRLACRVPVTVSTIYRDENEVAAARGGENLRLRLSGVDEEDIQAGFVICSRNCPVSTLATSGKVHDAWGSADGRKRVLYIMGRLGPRSVPAGCPRKHLSVAQQLETCRACHTISMWLPTGPQLAASVSSRARGDGQQQHWVHKGCTVETLRR